jgi:alkylation response protein AidB-like acyl-CoA dehydrogenase
MDFALSEEQQAIVDLATQIFTDLCAPERLREIEAGADWFHRDLWAELAKAGLLGIALPESVGGGGFGFLEACLLLERQGRSVAPVPLLPTLIAALAIAELGSDEQQAAWLPGVVEGGTILTIALTELGASPRDPQLGAVPERGDWVLSGAKTTVPAVHLAAAVVVPARDPEGNVRLFVVPTDAGGLTAERQDTFNHEPQFALTFDGVVVGADAELAGAGTSSIEGQAPIDWIVDRAIVGLCAQATGVSDTGMHVTAGYVAQRKQFDRVLGTFQAVGHRMADCYVDNEAIRLSMLLAASSLHAGAEADKEVAVAKYWASYSGSRVGHADLHLHGGISIDLDYSIHRYFLWSKQIEFQLGAAGPQLARLGAFLADDPVPA